LLTETQLRARLLELKQQTDELEAEKIEIQNKLKRKAPAGTRFQTVAFAV
jgi:hypothetical protein